MKRNIISIDENLCNGCGLCVSACHEGALQMVNGKARLVSESYCDGLGACLPECPAGAIKIEEREAAPFDEQAVAARMAATKTVSAPTPPAPLACGCPGTMAKSIKRPAPAAAPADGKGQPDAVSALGNWPVQIKLVPANAPYFENANLLIAADCTAYAYANMHEDFMKGKITLVGCPKLDPVDYSEKLTAIIRDNDIKSVTIVRMEVPCCGGLQRAAETALRASGKFIPWQVVTISRDGRILD